MILQCHRNWMGGQRSLGNAPNMEWIYIYIYIKYVCLFAHALAIKEGVRARQEPPKPSPWPIYRKMSLAGGISEKDSGWKSPRRGPQPARLVCDPEIPKLPKFRHAQHSSPLWGMEELVSAARTTACKEIHCVKKSQEILLSTETWFSGVPLQASKYLQPWDVCAAYFLGEVGSPLLDKDAARSNRLAWCGILRATLTLCWKNLYCFVVQDQWSWLRANYRRSKSRHIPIHRCLSSSSASQLFFNKPNVYTLDQVTSIYICTHLIYWYLIVSMILVCMYISYIITL